jgi:phospholipase C
MSNGPSAAVTGRAAVNSVVVLMLENRSFDHMPGLLYPSSTSPSGQPYDGLTGTEPNPGSDGKPVTVFKIEPGTPSACYMPGAGPDEGWSCSASPIGVSLRPGPADLLAR